KIADGHSDTRSPYHGGGVFMRAGGAHGAWADRTGPTNALVDRTGRAARQIITHETPPNAGEASGGLEGVEDERITGGFYVTTDPGECPRSRSRTSPMSPAPSCSRGTCGTSTLVPGRVETRSAPPWWTGGAWSSRPRRSGAL